MLFRIEILSSAWMPGLSSVWYWLSDPYRVFGTQDNWVSDLVGHQKGHCGRLFVVRGLEWCQSCPGRLCFPCLMISWGSNTHSILCSRCKIRCLHIILCGSQSNSPWQKPTQYSVARTREPPVDECHYIETPAVTASIIPTLDSRVRGLVWTCHKL
jgi:hypothetical protein